MRNIAGVIVFVVVISLAIDMLDYMATTERRLRALERDGNVIRGPWGAKEPTNEQA
jgi:hypothetical protein